MQKFYWNNQQPSYTQTDNCKPFRNISSRDPRVPSSQIYSDLSQLTLNINNNPTVTGPYKNGTSQTNIKQDQVFCVQVKNEAQQRGKNQCRNISAGNKVVLQLGDITVDNSHMITNEAVTRSMAPDARIYNRTWNENTNGFNEMTRGRQRKSIQNPNIFHHDYENVYNDNDFVVADKKCPSSSARSTPRSRKKKKHQQHNERVFRSKSCERVSTSSSSMLDRLSEKLSINSEFSPPSTPTPSLFQSVAARAIPCVDIKAPCHVGGDVSPTDSLEYQHVSPEKYFDRDEKKYFETCSSGQSLSPTPADIYRDLLRPAANLADKMRGRLQYVNKKMKVIRSRSAERLRGYMRNDTQDNRDNHHREDVRHLPTITRQPQLCHLGHNLAVLGQARAIVSSHPETADDKNYLSFQSGDIIDILQMNPNGLWRGRCGDRIGQFKFVNVELLPKKFCEDLRMRSRGRRRSERSSRRKVNSCHVSVDNIYELLRALNMTEHIPVFVLNGYEDLTLFKDLDEDELTYLGIHDGKDREKLIEMVELLFPDDNKNVSVDNEALHAEDENLNFYDCNSRRK